MIKKIIWIVIILIGIAGLYLALKTEPVGSDVPKTTTIYTSYLYKYSFEFEGTTENLKDADSANVSVLSGSSSPWIFNVSTQKGDTTRPLQALAEAAAKKITDAAEPVADREVAITDFKVADKPAKYVSISSLGDYGNAFVILVNGKNMLVVTGDDATPENKKAFLAFLKTFSFNVQMPNPPIPAQK